MFGWERNSVILLVLATLAILVGTIITMVMPFAWVNTDEDRVEGVTAYSALELAGRDIYVREGCYGCHSQMIRPFRSETERYGKFSVAGESVYDRPFQWGSKRTGPDLARVGGRYSDEWHVIHLNNPRDVVPESNMPGYPWLFESTVDPELIQRKLSVLQTLGDPYSDEEIEAAADAVKGKTEMEALVAYLQGLGLARSGR